MPSKFKVFVCLNDQEFEQLEVELKRRNTNSSQYFKDLMDGALTEGSKIVKLEDEVRGLKEEIGSLKEEIVTSRKQQNLFLVLLNELLKDSSANMYRLSQIIAELDPVDRAKEEASLNAYVESKMQSYRRFLRQAEVLT